MYMNQRKREKAKKVHRENREEKKKKSERERNDKKRKREREKREIKYHSPLHMHRHPIKKKYFHYEPIFVV